MFRSNYLNILFVSINIRYSDVNKIQFFIIVLALETIYCEYIFQLYINTLLENKN